MAKTFFMRKVRVSVFFVLLCLSVMCTCIFSSAHAALPAPLESGTSGSCIWKYERVGGDIVLTIAPTNGTEGTLDQPVMYDEDDDDSSSDFISGFPWNRSDYCENAKRIVVKGKVKAKGSTAYLFYGFQKVQSIDLSGLDITGVTNMEGMFEDCFSLTALDVCNWNVSNVTNMRGMFENCSTLISLELCNWDVANVTNMEGTFANCATLTALNVSNWNVAKVTNMNDMFFGCSNLTTLDVCNWDVSNVTNVKGMFSGCSALAALDLSKWNPPSGVSTGEMFKGTRCLGKISLGVSFHINDDAKFEDVGSHVGAKWMQVNLGKGGTHENPKGKVFESPSELLAFHHDRTKRDADVEEYVRIETSKVPEDEKLPGDQGSGSGDQEPVSIDQGSGSGDQEPVSIDRESSRDKNVSKRSSNIWREHYGQTFYLKNGKKLTGWQHLSGTAKDSSSTEKNWFCFDKNGAMLTGRHRLAGGSPDAKGKTKERWFYFDRKTGRQVRGWVKDRKGAWYYYSREDGAGLASGRYELEGGKGGGKRWFCFDEKGEQVRGWSPVGNQWYYYSKEDGAGLVGQHEIEGGIDGGKHWFYFDEKTGVQIRGWKHIDYQNKWCYYSQKDGAMLKGQHELVGGDKGGKHWFYFDEITGAELRNCWKKIPSQNKICYYGSDGAMYKG